MPTIAAIAMTKVPTVAPIIIPANQSAVTF